MIKSLNIFFLSFVLLISFTNCKNSKENATAKSVGGPKGLNAEGYIVQPEVFQNDISASGTLRPNEEVEIHPEVSGRITSISFHEGSYVRKGQTLVQLYDADILAQIQKLRAQRALQQKLLQRQEELVNIGGISKQDYETTQTQIASIDADIAFQQASLRKAKIVAPFDGKVGLRDVSVGAIVSPATVVATLQQLHPLKMDFTVPDQYKNNISVGKTVFFSVDGLPDSKKSGKIAAIDPGADVNTRSIRVRATVPNPNNELTAGGFAHVTIPLESNNDALLVPAQAVIPTTRDKKVAVVRNGKALLVQVELGARTDEKVEVTSGLVPGDTVIITGMMQVKPGMDVKITKVRG